MGVVPPAPGFLELLRERADQTGALLVFDEVISGFRVARGGAQERYGVLPDLTILGKIIGGGLPAAAYGGSPRADGADRAGRRRLPGRHAVGQSARGRGGAGDPRAARRRRLRAAGRDHRRARDGLREAAAGRDSWLPGAERARAADRRSSRSAPVRDYADAAACDLDAYGAWCRALLARGVYPPASQFEAWFPSLAHTGADVERTVAGGRATRSRSLGGEDRRDGAAGAARALRRAARSPAGAAERRAARRCPRRPGPAQIAAVARTAGGASASTSCCSR